MDSVMLLFIFLIVFITLIGILWLFARRIYAVPIIAAFYLVVVLYSVFGLFYYDYAREVPWDFFYKVDSEFLLRGALIYSSYAFSLVAGGVAVKRDSNRSAGNVGGQESGFAKVRIYAGRYWPVMVFIALISPCFLVISFGLDTLWLRSGYDIVGWQLGSIIARVFAPVSAIALVFIPIAFIRWFLFLVMYLSFYALTSRAVVLIPFFYFCAFYFVSGRFSWVRACVCSLFAVVGVVAALDMRLNTLQGLWPNLLYLFSGELTGEALTSGLNYVLSYSLTYLAYMLQSVDYDSTIFWISINPMPSAWVDIDYVMDYARVAPRIPYAALGEIFLMLGWYSLMLFMFFGLFFSKLEKFLMSRGFFFGILFIVLVVTCGLMSTQYNLRGAARLVYYSSSIFLLYWAWRFFSLLLRGKVFVDH